MSKMDATNRATSPATHGAASLSGPPSAALIAAAAPALVVVPKLPQAEDLSRRSRKPAKPHEPARLTGVLANASVGDAGAGADTVGDSPSGVETHGYDQAAAGLGTLPHKQDTRLIAFSFVVPRNSGASQ